MAVNKPFCPHCNSDSVVFSRKRELYLCADCRHEFFIGKPFIPRRLFISYGHDEHSLLAVRLKDDLKDRGHTVWFDEERLQPGHDWEAFIEQGLDDLTQDPPNSAVLLLLTPHAVRRPDGYCLNEVARALSRGLSIIPLMVVESEPPLSICRIQWLDMRECLPINENEAFYKPLFERLLRAIEDKQLDFEGTQSRLLSVLSPIQFSADIIRLLRDFTGRRWVFEEVDAWLKDPSGKRIFWITGAPGVGKSAMAAWIRDHRREIAAFHFCDVNSEEKRDPSRLVLSIAYQLSTQLPDYLDCLARLPLETIVQEFHEAYTLFDKLIVQPLAPNFPEPDRPIVILIDALDEATYRRQNEIVRFLTFCAPKTPHWLRFLVTSRPEPEIRSSFQALSPYVLDASRAENLEDIRKFLRSQFPDITSELTQILIDRSEGIFLYIRYVYEEVRNGRLRLIHPDEFPRGLGDVYKHFFDRQFAADLTYYEEEITPLLYLILASFEPLTLGYLQRSRGLESKTDLFRRLNRLGSLFPASGESDNDTIRPFHGTIRDWITVNQSAYPYYIDTAHGHKLLVDDGWSQYEAGPETMEDYFIEWLPSHLRVIEDYPRLALLLKDFRYLMEKTRRGMLERLLKDLRELPISLFDVDRTLDLEAAFFREKAHIVSRGNPEWPAYMILIQLAIEHADDSPLTMGAEKWLEEGRCDWSWLRRVQRVPHAGKNPCLAVLEGHTNLVQGALETKDGRFLSWSGDHTLRLWDREGRPQVVLNGHTDRVHGVLETRDGRFSPGQMTLRCGSGTGRDAPRPSLRDIRSRSIGALETKDGRFLSWSGDHTLRFWDREGRPQAVLEGHKKSVIGALETKDGRFLSWSGDSLRLWDREGRPQAVLEGHTNLVQGALETKDGRFLSWSNDIRCACGTGRDAPRPSLKDIRTWSKVPWKPKTAVSSLGQETYAAPVGPGGTPPGRP